MPKNTWIFAGILSVLLIAAVAFLQVRENSRQSEQADALAHSSALAAEGATRTNAVLAAELESLRAHAAELEQQVNQAAAARDNLAQQMRTELESRDVTISELQGRLTVNILDRVLFDSGEADLKPEGQAVLLKVARILTQNTNRQIQVIGHTDNVPIVNRTRGGFTDNWGLSAGRATAAVRFLHDKAGVDPRRLSAVGCGEFRPIADNSNPEGRARNRRIAVVILPEEISDLPRPTPSGTRPGSPPLSPPSSSSPSATLPNSEPPPTP